MNWPDELLHSLMDRPECRHEAAFFDPGTERCPECEFSARNWLNTHAPEILLAIFAEVNDDLK